MSINLTDEIEVKTKKGKLGAAKQIFLEGDTQTVEKEIQDINSRHNTLNTKHESLSRTVQGITVTGGASTANNVTYNNDISGLNAENAQDAIDELANKKFDKANIAQESGSAEDKVMSQNAVSDRLNDLSSTISEVNDKANYAYTKADAANKTAEANKQALTTATADISTLKKKVDDIPATITKFVNMSEAAYEALETKEADTYYMLTEE